MYQVIKNLFQWFQIDQISGDRSTEKIYPLEFPNITFIGVLTIVASRIGEGSTSAYYDDIDRKTKFKYTNDSVNRYITAGAFGISIGY